MPTNDFFFRHFADELPTLVTDDKEFRFHRGVRVFSLRTVFDALLAHLVEFLFHPASQFLFPFFFFLFQLIQHLPQLISWDTDRIAIIPSPICKHDVTIFTHPIQV